MRYSDVFLGAILVLKEYILMKARSPEAAPLCVLVVSRSSLLSCLCWTLALAGCNRSKVDLSFVARSFQHDRYCFMRRGAVAEQEIGIVLTILCSFVRKGVKCSPCAHSKYHTFLEISHV